MSAELIAGAVGDKLIDYGLDELFGGGSKSQPNYSYGYSGGNSANSSKSQSTNSSLSVQNPDSVWGVQSPYLADLYGQAQNIFGTGGNQQQAQQMWGQNAEAMQSLLNPGANPLMQVYQQQMQQGLEQNILPTIRREAANSGMIGGSREGVATGMALDSAQRQQSQFANQRLQRPG